MKYLDLKYNENGRDIAVGDIHGKFSYLAQELNRIKFDKSRDRLFVLGDLVDKGLESTKVLEWLSYPWLVALRGNHEQLAIDHYLGHISDTVYIQAGGSWNVLAESEFRLAIKEAFQKLPFAIRLRTQNHVIGMVHADIPGKDFDKYLEYLDNDLVLSDDRALIKSDETMRISLMGRHSYLSKCEKDVKGVDLLLVGHNCVDNPTLRGNTLYCDTASKPFKPGPFTFVDLQLLEQL